MELIAITVSGSMDPISKEIARGLVAQFEQEMITDLVEGHPVLARGILAYADAGDCANCIATQVHKETESIRLSIGTLAYVDAYFKSQGIEREDCAHKEHDDDDETE